jgi:hypothetical protein
MTMTMNKKKDYCVKAAFRRLWEVSQKGETDQQIQNLRQMNQDFDQKRKELEYEKTVRLLNLMKRPNK